MYGQQKILPVREDCILTPMNVYANSKVAAEHIVTQARTEGLKTNGTNLRVNLIF